MIKDKACDFFQPFQFGVACQSGAEKSVHKMSQCIEDNWPKDDFVVLKVDMSNAFNLVFRQAMLDECAQHFPELLSWSCWCHSQHPILWHQIGALSSQPQQGDPLDPFLFSLVLQCVVNTIKSDDGCVSLDLHAWCLDDGALAGKSSSVLECFQHLAVIIRPLTWPLH